MNVTALDLFCLAHVGSFLGFCDRARLARVCRKWREALQVWQADVKDYYSPHARVLQRAVRRRVLYNGYYEPQKELSAMLRLPYYRACSNFLNGPKPNCVFLRRSGRPILPPWVVSKLMHAKNEVWLDLERVTWRNGVLEAPLHYIFNVIRRIEVETFDSRVEIACIAYFQRDHRLQTDSARFESVSRRPKTLFVPKSSQLRGSYFRQRMLQLKVDTKIEDIAELLQNIRITVHSMLLPQAWCI